MTWAGDDGSGMTSMSDERPVFVDTNILVYAFDESDTERQQRAEGALAPLFLQDRIRLSTQVLQEFYVTMTRKVRVAWKPREALEVLDDLASWPLVVAEQAVEKKDPITSAHAYALWLVKTGVTASEDPKVKAIDGYLRGALN